MTNTNTHGGSRKGAGRKATGHITRTVRISPEQAEAFKELGGSAFLRATIDSIADGSLSVTLDTTRFTDEQKDRFVEGWEQAGGSTDDAESENPWFAPWFWQSTITVHGVKPEDWGADWYAQCKPEIDALLADDEE